MPAPALLHELGAPTLAAIEAAAERIRSHAVRTPLLESPAINALTGARVLFKAEVLQQAASFKFRGACNRLLQLTPAQRAAGVVAWSSGNHALAISAVARLLDMRATILMPSDAPSTKIDGARPTAPPCGCTTGCMRAARPWGRKSPHGPAPPSCRPTTIRTS